MSEDKKDIWLEGIKSIMGSTKRSLLDFIDMIEPKTDAERSALGKIKGRVHNDLSSAAFNVGALVSLMRSGGDIKPFEDTIIKKEGGYNRK